MSSVGGASNGPSSGSTAATVAGFSFGSAGYRVRSMRSMENQMRGLLTGGVRDGQAATGDV